MRISESQHYTKIRTIPHRSRGDTVTERAYSTLYGMLAVHKVGQTNWS